MTKFSLFYFWLLYGCGRVTFAATFRTRWHGDLRRRTAPALIVGKHFSYWDISALSIAARKIFKSVFPHFEMGTFYGYPFLGRVQWLMERYGAFMVMRPKDLIRIKHGTGKSKEELTALMQRVNDDAAKARRWVLESKRALVYFP
jgi:1-acyl-sn-glycerol-3-phosphate acyltransferase